MKSIVVYSAKGGVGKTTVAVGLAHALQRKGFKVGILDTDFTAPNVLIALNCDGLRATVGLNDIIIPAQVNGLKVISWGMFWPRDSAVFIEDKQITEDDLYHVINLIENGNTAQAVKHLRWLIEHPGGAIYYMRLLMETGAIDWGDLDWLVVDTPPTTSGVIKVVADADCYGSIIVSQPSSLALADVRRTLDMARKKAIPVLGLLGNMLGVGFDKKDSVVAEFAKAESVPYLGGVPFQPSKEKLDVVFDAITGKILSTKPVILPQRMMKESEWRESLESLSRVTRLLEALKSKP